MIGILLAAGFSRRFGASNKLLEVLPNGDTVALASAKNLIGAIPFSIAVVRPENKALADLLQEAGLKVFFCSEQDTEMADSLSAAIRFSAAFTESSDGFIIALADMPYIDSQTTAAIATKLNEGTSIVVPTYQGKRGHPVGFSGKFRDELASRQGDEGARSILKRYPEEVIFLECNDSGILADIDTPADLDQQLALRVKR
ncbi:nucleotidyltransferase family protein [Methylotenera sp.]|uniref:nucleotidyltransferase family protein n=1 Tax=Methylotenera sp. TaxID=2051956 RepID=UPI00248A2D92|nr:nucleotidyltransferase family protein [Methylotenera sp.]MDI1298258.1 nucleotidyltransferase family protein [Methylotenera sp.]